MRERIRNTNILIITFSEDDLMIIGDDEVESGAKPSKRILEKRVEMKRRAGE